MSREPRPLVAGNWKMNGLQSALTEIATMRQASEAGGFGAVELILCPPATLLSSAAAVLRGSAIGLGAQDCATGTSGAFTGDISAAMLKDAGASYVIVGHSERRAGHGETDALVRAKAQAAIDAGAAAIVCVGETKTEREAGEAVAVVAGQIQGSLSPDANPEKLVVAYEPVWAIGTGLTPTVKDVADMHAAIRGLLRQMYGAGGEAIRILYGGSVKPSNAKELLGVADVNGALVGGASLKAADFLGIASAYR